MATSSMLLLLPLLLCTAAAINGTDDDAEGAHVWLFTVLYPEALRSLPIIDQVHTANTERRLEHGRATARGMGRALPAA